MTKLKLILGWILRIRKWREQGVDVKAIVESLRGSVLQGKLGHADLAAIIRGLQGITSEVPIVPFPTAQGNQAVSSSLPPGEIKGGAISSILEAGTQVREGGKQVLEGLRQIEEGGKRIEEGIKAIERIRKGGKL